MAWLKRRLGKINIDYNDGKMVVVVKLDDRQYDPNSLSDLVAICGSVILGIVEEIIVHQPAEKRNVARAVCLSTVGQVLLSSVKAASDTSWMKSDIEA